MATEDGSQSVVGQNGHQRHHARLPIMEGDLLNHAHRSEVTMQEHARLALGLRFHETVS